MGYSANRNSFWPDDDENTIYLDLNGTRWLTLSDIIEVAKNKWGDSVDFDSVRFNSENIHTDCLGYDLHDPSDYTNFTVITKDK